MTQTYYAQAVLAIAANEIGYLEKRTNSDLYDKTANAGSGNYTKYAYEIDKNFPTFYNGPKNGYPWCDAFVDWCILTAFGLAGALYVLCQPRYSAGAGCSFSLNYYRSNGRCVANPKPGDQIFFYDRSGDVAHTGLVYKVDSTYVYTIEGNTSYAEGVVPNGGAVANKKYRLDSSSIAGYGRPRYTDSPDGDGLNNLDINELSSYTSASSGFLQVSQDMVNTDAIDPFIATISRKTSKIDVPKLSSIGVIGVVLEAGYLYDSSHCEVKYRNPKISSQMKQIQSTDMPWGFYSIVRARSQSEALRELYELSFLIRKYPPLLGVWLQLNLSNSVSVNNKIIDVYEKELVRLGLKDKIGFYVTKTQLKKITWEDYCDRWNLWLIEHVDSIDNIKDKINPEFFMIN